MLHNLYRGEWPNTATVEGGFQVRTLKGYVSNTVLFSTILVHPGLLMIGPMEGSCIVDSFFQWLKFMQCIVLMKLGKNRCHWYIGSTLVDWQCAFFFEPSNPICNQKISRRPIDCHQYEYDFKRILKSKKKVLICYESCMIHWHWTCERKKHL